MKPLHLIATVGLLYFAIADTSAQDEQSVSQGCLFAFGNLESPLVPGQKPERLIDIETLRSSAGSPQEIRTSTYKDHYSGDPVDSIALQYQSFDVRAERISGSRARFWWLRELRIRSSERKLPCRLAVGRPATCFRALLGTPLLSSNEAQINYEWLKLEEREGLMHAWHAGISLTVLEDGNVSQVSWSWYRD